MIDFSLPIEVWTVTNLTSTSQTISDLYVGGSAITIPANATVDLVVRGCSIVSITRSVNSGSLASLISNGRLSHSGYLHSHKGSFEVTNLPDATQWHKHFGMDVLTAGDASNADLLHTHSQFVKITDIDDLISESIGDIDLSVYAKISDGISQFLDVNSTGQQIDESVLKTHEEEHTLLEHINDIHPFTIDNFKKLFDGSNADCLHIHAIPDGGVSVHNDLSGIQGGASGQYYHLSLNGYNYFNNLFSNVSVQNLITLTDGSNADFLHTHNFASSLVGLSDVYIDNLNNMDVLVYDSHINLWRNESFPECSYTNANTSVITVGGINSGTTFDNTSFSDFVDMLLYPELFGTLTDPSSSFNSSVTGYREIGEVIATITFTSTFIRGSISPQHESDSEFRSGLPNTYIYSGTDLIDYASTVLTDSESISNYTVIPGNQSWTGRVAYDVGVQPKGSKGTNFNSPLSAGMTNNVTRTILGVYPFFATTENITGTLKQPLVSHTSTFFSSNTTIVMVAESGGYKQKAEFPEAFSNITGIQFYNTNNNTWEWISGTKASSLLTFDITSITKDINGNNINYKVYTHNGSLIGSRQLRFYTT